MWSRNCGPNSGLTRKHIHYTYDCLNINMEKTITQTCLFTNTTFTPKFKWRSPKEVQIRLKNKTAKEVQTIPLCKSNFLCSWEDTIIHIFLSVTKRLEKKKKSEWNENNIHIILISVTMNNWFILFCAYAWSLHKYLMGNIRMLLSSVLNTPSLPSMLISDPIVSLSSPRITFAWNGDEKMQ